MSDNQSTSVEQLQSVKTHSWDRRVPPAVMSIYFDAKQVTDWRPLPTPPVAPSPETWKASGPVQMYTDPQNPDHLSFDPFAPSPEEKEKE